MQPGSLPETQSVADEKIDKAQAISRYKAQLKALLDERPSGLRGQLAVVLGKHKSFISQIPPIACRSRRQICRQSSMSATCRRRSAKRFSDFTTAPMLLISSSVLSIHGSSPSCGSLCPPFTIRSSPKRSRRSSRTSPIA